MSPDDFPTPAAPRPGTAALAVSHTIEIDVADANSMADFLEALSFILRARRRVRVTIE